MLFSHFSVLMGVAATVPLAFAANIPAEVIFRRATVANGTPDCNQSDASPDTGDVTSCINELFGKGGDCKFSSDSALGCTKLCKHKTVQIDICGNDADDVGDEWDPHQQLSCATVGQYVDAIQQGCKTSAPTDASAKVGGTLIPLENTKLTIKVYHS